MACCQCQGLEREFNSRRVRREVRRMRRGGPSSTTRILIGVLRDQDVSSATLIDIGGGLGAVQFGLLAAGAVHATSVDASSAYEAAAREEARRRAVQDRITYLYGDFTELAPQLADADVVTLDRVICCYHDMPRLVDASTRRARRLYGVVYPRENWWSRAGVRAGNLYLRLTRSPMRAFIHPTAAVDRRIRENGFEPVSHRETGFWQIAVYRRSVAAGGAQLRSATDPGVPKAQERVR